MENEPDLDKIPLKLIYLKLVMSQNEKTRPRYYLSSVFKTCMPLPVSPTHTATNYKYLIFRFTLCYLQKASFNLCYLQKAKWSLLCFTDMLWSYMMFLGLGWFVFAWDIDLNQNFISELFFAPLENIDLYPVIFLYIASAIFYSMPCMYMLYKEILPIPFMY